MYCVLIHILSWWTGLDTGWTSELHRTCWGPATAAVGLCNICLVFIVPMNPSTFLATTTGVWFRGCPVSSQTVFGSIGCDVKETGLMGLFTFVAKMGPSNSIVDHDVPSFSVITMLVRRYDMVWPCMTHFQSNPDGSGSNLWNIRQHCQFFGGWIQQLWMVQVKDLFLEVSQWWPQRPPNKRRKQLTTSLGTLKPVHELVGLILPNISQQKGLSWESPKKLWGITW